MKGNNTLILNQATMQEALQEWIDKRMGAYAPQIGWVVNDTFEVQCSDKIT